MKYCLVLLSMNIREGEKKSQLPSCADGDFLKLILVALIWSTSTFMKLKELGLYNCSLFGSVFTVPTLHRLCMKLSAGTSFAFKNTKKFTYVS